MAECRIWEIDGLAYGAMVCISTGGLQRILIVLIIIIYEALPFSFHVVIP